MNPWMGVSALGLVALVGGAFSLRWLWRKKIKRGYLLSYGTLIFPAPGRISLGALSAGGEPNTRVQKRTAAFHQLGFQDVAAYSINELGGSRLFVLSHPLTGLVALIHEYSCAGTWSDVMKFSSIGEAPILASNVRKHTHFQALPGDPKFHHADADEGELVRVVEAARAHDGATQAIDARSFPRLCERAYAHAADERFRNLPGENEVRRHIKEVCPEAELTDAEITALHRLLPELIANDWRISCLRDFVNSGGITAREWQQARERILVVHDHTPLRTLDRCRTRSAFLTTEIKRRLKKAGTHLPPREEFARLNAALPPSERYKKIGSVVSPVPADIYRAWLPGGVS